MPLAILRPAAGLPLDIAEVRQHLKQDIEDDDNLIRIYLHAAAATVEAETGRQLLAARFRYILDSFPGPQLYPGVPYGVPFSVPPHAILLPRSPLIRLLGLYYLDMGGNQQTVPPDLYTLDAALDQARITPRFGRIWPIPLPQPGAVWVDFEAGYVAPFTVSSQSNTLTVDGWPTLADGDAVRVSNSGGALPSPLKPRLYYIASVESDGVYTLAATPDGPALDFTTSGTGTHYLGRPGGGGSDGLIPPAIAAWMLLRADTHYGHRGEHAVIKGTLAHLPYADRLLDPYRLIQV